uniref:Uncharacterized protein n=1 Tax=Physcomitrium patens TaxID=3218 RepID=A0A2K1KE03_PHYPA|nr:hypothetical protein PHYPA_008372 [Physcomitrium patens]
MVKVSVVADSTRSKANGYRSHNAVIDLPKKYTHICLEFVSIKFWSSLQGHMESKFDHF